jgi:hypothetical protein
MKYIEKCRKEVETYDAKNIDGTKMKIKSIMDV